jgi:hypothetical protein
MSLKQKEWSYRTSKEELVNHPSYANPVIIKKNGTVYVCGYEKEYLFGLIKTTIKTDEYTVWESGHVIFQMEDSNV